MASILDRLKSLRTLQGTATVVIARKSTASSVQSESEVAPVTDDLYLNLFNELLDPIAKFWGYSDDDKVSVTECGMKEENLIPLVKSWMVDCITYEIPISSKLRSRCYSEFQEAVKCSIEKMRSSKISKASPSLSAMIELASNLKLASANDTTTLPTEVPAVSPSKIRRSRRL